MKTLLTELKTSLLLTLVFAVLLCGAYPLAVWASAQALFPAKANGSLIAADDGTVRGSALLAQNFSSGKYFQPRPSAAGTGGSEGVLSLLDIRGQTAIVRDLDSLNGVFVKMTQEEELTNGQILRIGQELLRFELIGTPEPTADGTELMGSPNPGYWGKLTVIIGREVTVSLPQ